MALSTTESHENEKFQDISRLEAENARMLKEIEQMRELIAGWVFVYLWIGWMLQRLGNRKLLLCSPGGLEERNGMF